MDFTNVQETAKFLASINFTINSSEEGDFSPDHIKYRCTFEKQGNSFDATYQSNPEVHGDPT